ncbi:MAG: TonB-dependent receptor [Bacteroidia bacterium]|nr:TonB-dependent receptor [Bacteroidia bacterium]
MKGILTITAMFCATGAWCQSVPDSAIVLPGAEIKIQRVSDFNAGNRTVKLSSGGFGSLTNSLTENNTVFVKQYGPGLLSTASVRGLSASQVALLWNGINIQSTMLGLTDFSLLPSFFTDNASIQFGGSSAVHGNGAMAGAISLNNSRIVPNTLQVIGQAGSFGLNTQGIRMSYGKGKFSGQTRVFRSDAVNNYSYHDYYKAGNPLMKRNNAAFMQNGFLQEVEFAPGKKSLLSGRLWYNMADRQLPAPLGSSENAKERQYDDATRALLSYNYKSNKIEINGRTAFLQEKINYYNNNLPTSYSIARSYIFEGDVSYSINNSNSVLIGINQTFNTAKSDGYLNWVHQNISSAYAGWRFSQGKDKLLTTFMLRQIISGKNRKPLTGSAGAEYQLTKVLRLIGSVATSYRMPTLNDLYWSAGGNPNLKAESGFKQEGGFRIKLKRLSIETQVFRNAVHNWIIWLPSQNSGIWSPVNIRDVTAMGVEETVKYKLEFKRFSLTADGSYAYIRSINKSVEKGNEAIVNKQLIYVPQHIASLCIGAETKSWKIKFYNNYTGKRFTTTDNKFFLPYYFICDAEVSKKFLIKTVLFESAFRVNNYLNKTYEIIERRPMPGLNFTVSLKAEIKFKTKLNKNKNI